MIDMSKYPTPWNFCGSALRDANGEVVLIPIKNSDALKRIDIQKESLNLLDPKLQFIIHAVNLHDRLVSEFSQLIDGLKWALNRSPDGIPCDDCLTTDIESKGCLHVINGSKCEGSDYKVLLKKAEETLTEARGDS